MNWHQRLADLVAEGIEVRGKDAVRDALHGALSDLAEPAVPEALAPATPVLGVSACDSGWVAVLVRPSGRTTLHLGSTVTGLVEQVREQESLGVVVIDAGSDSEESQAWLRTRPTVEVALVETPVLSLEEVASKGMTVPAMYPGMGFSERQLLAACSAVIVGAWRTHETATIET